MEVTKETSKEETKETKLTKEEALKLLQEEEDKRMTDANNEITAILQKYNLSIQPRIVLDLVPNK